MRLPRLIYGTLSLERVEPGTAARLVHAAVDLGLTALDTAPLYGLGAVERMVGAAVQGCRGRVQILTKCGIRWDHPHGAELFRANVGGSERSFRANGQPASVREEVHASLSRLGVDVIDVIQLHRFDEQVPLEETLGALSDLVREGKVRAIGVSNFPLAALERARRASRDGELFSTQDEYSALERGAEQGSLGFARQAGTKFLAYSPLAGGALAGRHLGAEIQLDDHRKDAGAFQPENSQRIAAVLASVAQPIARRQGATLSQLGLCWVLAQPGVTAAIVGSSSEAQLVENAGALGAQFSPEDLDVYGRAVLSASPARHSGSVLHRIRARARRALGRS